MNALQKGTVALLKSALTGQAQTLPENFDLEAAWPVLKRHNIDPLLYEGAVLCGCPTDTEFMQKLFRRVCRGMIINEGQLRELNRLYDAFDANGIQYMPLKGIKMKKRYPRPELRPMGDADVLIRLDQYPKIVPILESLGYQSVLESDHELVWKTKSLYLELHKWVIPSYNEDYFAYFGSGWRLATKSKGCRWSMSAENELIYMFTHFAKHYRDGGIGCRHVIDLWIYSRTHPEMDEAFVRQELEKLDLLKFYDNISHVLAMWFDGAEGNEIGEHITEFVFSSGSWGDMESHFQSNLLRKEAQCGKGMSAKAIYVWSMLFPGMKSLQERYPVLEKAPWLLPFVWCYRLVKQAFFWRSGLQKHEKQLKAATNESMEIRRQMLEQVGLRY